MLFKAQLVSSTMLALLVGCGAARTEVGADDTDEEQGSTLVVQNSTNGQSRTIQIPATVSPSRTVGNQAEFGLTASATTWSIQMTGCLSGYTATVTHANLDGLEAYKNDRDCLAKLTQFTFNGRTYVPTSGDPFTTWQPGDIAKFDEVGEPGVEPLYVAVMTTLSNPISSIDTISYSFSSLLSGQDRSILWVTEGATGGYNAGIAEAASFSIRSTALTGTTAGEGGKFRFVMECTTTIGVTNQCANFDFTATDYKLVADTYGGAPTSSELDTIFATAGTSVTLPGDRVAPGDEGTANGGFKTVVLDGPDNMATTPQMLVLVRSGASYNYFNVDVVVATSY